jgi:hypothetical protein
MTYSICCRYLVLYGLFVTIFYSSKSEVVKWFRRASLKQLVIILMSMPKCWNWEADKFYFEIVFKIGLTQSFRIFLGRIDPPYKAMSLFKPCFDFF